MGARAGCGVRGGITPHLARSLTGRLDPASPGRPCTVRSAAPHYRAYPGQGKRVVGRKVGSRGDTGLVTVWRRPAPPDGPDPSQQELIGRAPDRGAGRQRIVRASDFTSSERHRRAFGGVPATGLGGDGCGKEWGGDGDGGRLGARQGDTKGTGLADRGLAPPRQQGTARGGLQLGSPSRGRVAQITCRRCTRMGQKPAA